MARWSETAAAVGAAAIGDASRRRLYGLTLSIVKLAILADHSCSSIDVWHASTVDGQDGVLWAGVELEFWNSMNCGRDSQNIVAVAILGMSRKATFILLSVTTSEDPFDAVARMDVGDDCGRAR